MTIFFATKIRPIKILGLPRSKQQESTYKNLDNDPRGVWASDNLLRTEVRDYAVLVSHPLGDGTLSSRW